MLSPHPGSPRDRSHGGHDQADLRTFSTISRKSPRILDAIVKRPRAPSASSRARRQRPHAAHQPRLIVGREPMSEIRNVTGTAFVVAEFRAQENEAACPL